MILLPAARIFSALPSARAGERILGAAALDSALLGWISTTRFGLAKAYRRNR